MPDHLHALLSFPPQSWSLRWFVKAFSYRDFQSGFSNGVIVMYRAIRPAS